MDTNNTLYVEGKSINVIWQPKYMEPRAGVWLLQQKMFRYMPTEGEAFANHDVYITFEKDLRYGLSGRVFLVEGGAKYILDECEVFSHTGTGQNYYLIPLNKLVEIFDLKLPRPFMERIEEYKRLHEHEEQ